LVLSFLNQDGDLRLVFFDDSSDKFFEIFKKLGSERSSVAELWELAVNGPNNSDIVVPDEL